MGDTNTLLTDLDVVLENTDITDINSSSGQENEIVIYSNKTAFVIDILSISNKLSYHIRKLNEFGELINEKAYKIEDIDPLILRKIENAFSHFAILEHSKLKAKSHDHIKKTSFQIFDP